MIHIWNKARALGAFLRSRAFAVSALSVVLAFVVFKVTTMTNTVYVADGQGRTLHFTMEDTSSTVLEQMGLNELAQTQAATSGFDGHYAQVSAASVAQVTVSVDGKSIPCQAPIGTTVGELLYQRGISYDGNDLLTPGADKPLQSGDRVVLKRVEYEEYTEQKTIPYTTIRKNTSLLKVGSNKCIQEGQDGQLTKTYVQRTVDGVKEDVQLLGEHVTRQPVTETILIGSLTPVSKLDFDLNVDENGRPIKYKRLLENQVATGYSARPGAKTASGRYAVPGHVAVNPNEIPYGSKLYIVSTDNKFVYGCAVAADTGIGLMADVVDVDLFYDTYQESVLNGRRSVDIYVLE